MASSVKVLESRFVQSCTSIANAPQISHAEIAILGRSNVGKSSLINALLNNKNLAKSSSTPGKTRLVNLFISKWQLNSLNSSLGAPCGDFGNLGRFADAPVQSHAPNSQKTSQLPPQNTRIADSNKSDSRESANPPKQTIEGIAVEVAEFLPNFQGNCVLSDETRLEVCEHSKFGKSVQDAPKSELSAQEFAIHILDFPGFGYARVSKSERDSWDKNLSTFLKKRESIKLFIHLIDSRHTNLPLDDEIRAFLRSNLRADADILEVFTKADKLKKSEIHALKGRILVSTTKKDLGQRDFKDNIESLRHAILRTMYHI